MDLIEIEREMARLDAVYRPVATRPLDPRDLDALTDVGAAVASELARLGVGHQAEATLHAVIGLYRADDKTVRAAIRRLFDRYTSFRWAAHLPRDWDTAEEFRDRLVHLSARDQGADARDEILTLQDLCWQARQDGIDVDPILDEVAAISSDVDRYGMGSMRSILLGYVVHWTVLIVDGVDLAAAYGTIASELASDEPALVTAARVAGLGVPRRPRRDQRGRRRDAMKVRPSPRPWRR